MLLLLFIDKNDFKNEFMIVRVLHMHNMKFSFMFIYSTNWKVMNNY